MKNQNFYIFHLLLIWLFTMFATGCKKDDDNGGGGNNTFTDTRDGNIYKIVAIGNQIWMAENLRYLPSVAGPGSGSTTIPHYYVYNYDGTVVNAAKATENYTIYGVLYNWAAAMAGTTSSSANPSGVQGICPSGWHLPSDAEWAQLNDYLGGAYFAGGKLKQKGTLHWFIPNTGATNETAFTALPGGRRGSDGQFYNICNYGFWWTATKYSADFAWDYSMGSDISRVNKFNHKKEIGFSVRCVRD